MDAEKKKLIYKNYAALRKLVDWQDGYLVVDKARIGQHFFACRHEENAKTHRSTLLKYLHKIDLAQQERKKQMEAQSEDEQKVQEGREESQGGVAGVLVQQPNRYGIVEDYSGFADCCHQQKALFMMSSVAADLALLKTPGEWGADVAVGDGQSLGIPMQFGGPYVGYMCCTEKLIR